MKKGLRNKKRRTKAKTLTNKKILLTVIILIIFSLFLIFSKFSVASTLILGAGVNITDGTIIRLTGLNCNMTVVNDLIVDKLEVYPNFLLITASLAAPTYILNLPYNYSSATSIINVTGIPNATTNLAINISTFGNGIKIYSVSPFAYLTSVSWSNSGNFSLTINASAGTNSTATVYWPYSIAPTVQCINCAAYSSSFNSTTDMVTLIANHSSLVTWNLYNYSADITAPTYSNVITGSPSNYSPSTSTWFNVTWIDNAAISKVIIESNYSGSPTNYTPSQNGNVYYTSMVLPASTFYWKSYANDTSNNWNTSSTQTFTIGNGSVPLILSSNMSWSGTYPSPTNTTGSGCPSQITCNLYRNGSSVANPDMNLFGAGTYVYVYNTTGSQNYSANSTTNTLTINKGPTQSIIYLNSSTSDTSYQQPGMANITGTISVGTLTVYLDMNATGYGNNFTSATGSVTNITNVTKLALGTYNVTAHSTGNANYSSSSVTSYLTVTTTAPTYSYLKSSPSSPATYSSGQSYKFNATWNDNLAISTVIFEWQGTNNTVSTHQGSEYYYTYPSDLTPGTYSYAWYANNTNNIWTKTTVQTYIVNKSFATLSLTVSPSNSTTYPTSTIANGSVITGDPVGKYNISLYRNGNLVNSTTSASFTYDINTLGASIWNYTLVYNGTQNYTYTTITNITNVNTGVLSLSISGSNATYPASVLVNGTRGGNSGDTDVNYTLWRDNILISSGNGTSGNLSDTTLLGVGSYYYTYNAIGGTNWTANSTGVTLNINVGQGTPTLAISISPSANVNYPTTTTATGSGCPSQGASDVNCTLWVNGVFVSSAIASNPSPDTAQPIVGTYVYAYNATGGFNWTSASTQATLIVSGGGNNGGGGGGGGGNEGGGGKVLYSLNLSNVPSLIEVNQNSSKTICFILENVGSAELKNISVKLSGIDSSWFTASPNFIGYLNASENTSVCISFNIPEIATVKDYQININASSKAIKSVSATLRVMAKSSLSQCPVCPACLNWTSCVNNSQTRTCYKCDETTNYACVENVEAASCEAKKQPEVVTTTYIIALIVLIVIVISIIGIILIRRRKTVTKVEEVYRKEDNESQNTPN